jgi:uncharacterized membrane protein
LGRRSSCQMARHRIGVAHVLFFVGAVGKGIDGVLETIGGILLFFVSPNQIHFALRILTQHELSEDPKDLVAAYLLYSTRDLTAGTTAFAAMYLLSHGAVKIALVAGLLLKQRWAYPSAIAAFSLFVVYQLYRYSHTHSPELLVLSVVDVLVIVVTWLEYKRLLRIHGFARRAGSRS